MIVCNANLMGFNAQSVKLDFILRQVLKIVWHVQIYLIVRLVVKILSNVIAVKMAITLIHLLYVWLVQA